MRQCGKLIKSFKPQMELDKGLREDEHAHLQCIIRLLLAVYLKEGCKIAAQLREIHLKKYTESTTNMSACFLYELNFSAVKIEEEAKIRRALEEEFEREASADGGGEDGSLKEEEGCEKMDDEEKLSLIPKEVNDQDEKAKKKAFIQNELSKVVRNNGIRQRDIKHEPMTQFEQELHFESTAAIMD